MLTAKEAIAIAHHYGVAFGHLTVCLNSAINPNKLEKYTMLNKGLKYWVLQKDGKWRTVSDEQFLYKNGILYVKTYKDF